MMEAMANINESWFTHQALISSLVRFLLGHAVVLMHSLELRESYHIGSVKNNRTFMRVRASSVLFTLVFHNAQPIKDNNPRIRCTSVSNTQGLETGNIYGACDMVSDHVKS